MTDMFQIIPKQTGKPKLNKVKENIITRYTLLQGEFLSRSYGYYTNYFIQKIAIEAIANNAQIQVLSVNKTLRDLVRKFILSDLELVFVGHIANLLEWSFNKTFYKQNCQKMRSNSENLHKNIEVLNFFMNLIAYFVKSYVGQIEESAALTDFLSLESEGLWESVYEEWVKNLPSEIFNLSPRAINTIYNNYTRDCQKSSLSKNYNAMVDRILELSTTYSMMPGEVKQPKKGRLPEIVEEEEAGRNGRKAVKKNIITQSYLSNVSKKQESSLNEPLFQESRISNSFLDSAPRAKQSEIEPKQRKKTQLKLRTKNQQVTNHISQFYSKKQYDLPGGRQEFRPQSTIGFQNSVPSFLDFNNRSSVYEAIPYTLKNNSNLSSFWK